MTPKISKDWTQTLACIHTASILASKQPVYRFSTLFQLKRENRQINKQTNKSADLRGLNLTTSNARESLFHSLERKKREGLGSGSPRVPGIDSLPSRQFQYLQGSYGYHPSILMEHPVEIKNHFSPLFFARVARVRSNSSGCFHRAILD